MLFHVVQGLHELLVHFRLQLLGKPFGEETILKIAHAYEQCTGWHKEKPSISVIKT